MNVEDEFFIHMHWFLNWMYEELINGTFSSVGGGIVNYDVPLTFL